MCSLSGSVLLQCILPEGGLETAQAKYCKPLPNSASASMPARQLTMRRGQVSTRQADVELFHAISTFIDLMRAFPKSIRTELPRMLQLTQAFVGRGARPDVFVAMRARPGSFRSCLSRVCECDCTGLEPLLELLLAADSKPAVDVNAAYETTPGTIVTPMCYAILARRPSIVRLLVTHGADLKAPCCQDGGAYGRLFWPVQVCVTRIYGDLLANRSTNGALETLDYLLSAGADVDAIDDRELSDLLPESTPLLGALLQQDLMPASRSVLDVVAMKLINAGADVNARNHLQVRALDHASTLPSLEVFKALIAKGADPSPTPYVAETVAEGAQSGTHYLQVAAENGRVDVLRAAASAGVNLKKARTLGSMAISLLAHAAYHGEFGCVGFLLDYGCDVNEVYETKMGKLTVSDLFGDRNPSDGDIKARVLKLLRDAGGKFYEEL